MFCFASSYRQRRAPHRATLRYKCIYGTSLSVGSSAVRVCDLAAQAKGQELV